MPDPLKPVVLAKRTATHMHSRETAGGGGGKARHTWRFVMLLTAGLSLAGGCTFHPIEQPKPGIESEPPRGTLSTTSARAEVRRLQQLLETVHPDPYFHRGRRAFRADAKRLVTRLKQPVDRLSFYRSLQELVASLGDPHTALSFPITDFRAYGIAGGTVFPFDVRWIQGHLVMASEGLAGASLKQGDLILSVNGVQPEDLMRGGSDKAPCGTASQAYSKWQVARRFGRHLWLHGERAPFDVLWRPVEGGDPRREVFGGKAAVPSPAGEQEAWRARRLSGGILYLSMNGMTGDLGAFNRFLDSCFQRKPVRGVVVDLRENTGGDTRFAETMLRYLTRKPYRLMAGKEWKLSLEYRSYLTRLYGGLPPDLSGVAPGQTALIRRRVRSRPAASVSFSGPVCFLIGPGTFSSATMLAAAVKDYRLGTLIGEPTGGCPGGFGEVGYWQLPSSGFRVSVSTARFYRREAGQRGRPGPVQPDIVVAESARDIRRGRDAVLKRAQEWLLENRRDSD